MFDVSQSLCSRYYSCRDAGNLFIEDSRNIIQNSRNMFSNGSSLNGSYFQNWPSTLSQVSGAAATHAGLCLPQDMALLPPVVDV
jgi:hypothetical protein